MNVVQRSCGVSILGNIQKPSGHVPEQSGLGDLASAGDAQKMNPTTQKIGGQLCFINVPGAWGSLLKVPTGCQSSLL